MSNGGGQHLYSSNPERMTAARSFWGTTVNAATLKIRWRWGFNTPSSWDCIKSMNSPKSMTPLLSLSALLVISFKTVGGIVESETLFNRERSSPSGMAPSLSVSNWKSQLIPQYREKDHLAVITKVFEKLYSVYLPFEKLPSISVTNEKK